MSETLRMPPEAMDTFADSIAACPTCGTPVTKFTVTGIGTPLVRVMEAVLDRDDPGLIHLSPHDCTPVVLPVAVKRGQGL